MKALLVIYALGVIGWMGVVYGNEPDEAPRYPARVVLMSFFWPVLLVFSAGQLLGKWARK